MNSNRILVVVGALGLVSSIAIAQSPAGGTTQAPSKTGTVGMAANAATATAPVSGRLGKVDTTAQTFELIPATAGSGAAGATTDGGTRKVPAPTGNLSAAAAGATAKVIKFNAATKFAWADAKMTPASVADLKTNADVKVSAAPDAAGAMVASQVWIVPAGTTPALTGTVPAPPPADGKH